MKKPSTITKKNWHRYATLALLPLGEPRIEIAVQHPWQCTTCGSERAGIHMATGQPICAQCPSAREGVVPGPPLDLGRRWGRGTAWAGDDELGVIAVVAGTRLVSPMARRQFTMGTPAGDFWRTLQTLVLTTRGLACDDYGIWRRPDGSRLDGTDAMDLLMGIPGVWSPEQIRDFDGDDADAQVKGDSDLSAEVALCR